jgi:hypothetical protein
MLQNEDIVDPPIRAGYYKRILVTVYTDDQKTTVDVNLAGTLVTWRLQGARGDLVTKTSAGDGGITIDDPTKGIVAIELLETDTEGLTRGYYTHIADLTSSGHKRDLFSGDVFIEDN